MKLKSIKNPSYNKFGTIDCEILIEGYKDYFPFTASPDDKEPHGRRIFDMLKSGKYGEVEPYNEPAGNDE